MPHQIILTLQQIVELAIALMIVGGVLGALIAYNYVHHRIEKEKVTSVATFLDSLYRKGTLEAIRFKNAKDPIFARRDKTTFEVPPKSAKVNAHELSPGSFIGLDRQQLWAAINRLCDLKHYEVIKWHEDGEENMHELKIRPEFMHQRQPRA